MKVAEKLKQLQRMAPGNHGTNGAKDTPKSGKMRVPAPGPRQVLLVAVPIALVATAAVARQRRQSSAGLMDTVKAKARRHKPKSVARYYGLTLLINALERDATRKAVLAGLKWARKRS